MTEPHFQELLQAWTEHRAYVVDLAFRMLDHLSVSCRQA